MKRKSSKGFFLAELQIAAAILAVLTALLYGDFLALTSGWQKLTADVKMQNTARYMLNIMEKDLGYEGKTINLERDKKGLIKITCQTNYGGKKFIYTCEDASLYKQTKTTSTLGKNPLFMPGYAVRDWQVQRLTHNMLQISFNLEYAKRSKRFSRIIYCINGRVTDAET